MISAINSITTRADSTPPPTYYPDRDTVIVDGKPVTLHDLGLTQKTLDQIVPTGKVADALKTFSNDLSLFGGSSNFYKLVGDLTAPVRGQYVLVNQLPSNCIFTPPENLPPGVQTANVGCTQGKITYLVPDLLRKMDDTQKALLLIHERLHAFSAVESFEVKTDIVKAANILITKYHPAITNPQPTFAYTTDELTILNQLTTRLSQILNSSGNGIQPIWNVQFVSSGGYIQAPQITIDAQDLTISPGSFIFLKAAVHLRGTGLRLLKNSSITSQDTYCCYTNNGGGVFDLTLNDVTATNSTITIAYPYTVVLNHATITDSSVYWPDQQNISNLEITNSVVVDYSDGGKNDCTISVSNIRIRNVKSYSGTICANDVDLENSDRLDALWLYGSAITVTGSTTSEVRLAGNRISLISDSANGSDYSGDDIRIESSNIRRSTVSGINHFTQIATTLENTKVNGSGVSVQNVTFDHAELSPLFYGHDGFQASFYSSTTLQHASLQAMDDNNSSTSVTLGTDGQTIVLEGNGNAYKIKSMNIRNQSDLDQVLNPPKPGTHS